MQRYIISYDLYRPANNYSDFTSQIKQLGEDWAHPLANLWIVETRLEAEDIRQILSDYLISGDKLVIFEIGRDEVAMDLAPPAHCHVAAANTTKRTPVKLLANVLSHPAAARESRLLTAATGGN
ncbi:MAG: DUF2207 domain-containing protein [Hyphomicrobiales bacterium]|nr:DUF2207 domain-containing protein [Hyphomicrobiales bacterium]